jgi:hypothetical protein
VHFVARTLDPVRCDAGLAVIPTDTPETLRDPDMIVVPGSGNPVSVLSDEVLIDWLRTPSPNCQWTASVCTGAGLYAAGLLEGKKTTTHWGLPGQPKGDGCRGGRRPRGLAGQPHQRSRRFRRHGHGARPDRARARAQAGRVPTACDRVRPATPVRHRLTRQGRRQHAAPRAPSATGRPALPNGGPDQPAECRSKVQPRQARTR